MRKAIAITIGGVIFVMGILCNIVMQVAPEDAVSNTAKWIRATGFNAPSWLQSRNTDHIVHWVGILLMIFSGLWVVWSIFFVGRTPSRRTNPMRKFLKKFNIDDVVEAWYGAGRTDLPDNWRDATKGNRPLIDLVKQLVPRPDAAFVTLADLRNASRLLSRAR